MTFTPYTPNNERYIQYYLNQAGGDLDGFMGAQTQYGAGLGGIFRNLFSFAMPLFKRGLNIVKPHLKTAATNIAGDVISSIVRRKTTPQQEGNGLFYYGKRGMKRPPSSVRGRSHTSKKRKTCSTSTKRVKPRKHNKASTSKRKHRAHSSKDIF